MKLLITGATGFIGTNFILQLHSKYQITAIVREKSNTTTIAPFCSIFSYDGDIQKLIDFCQKEKFDGVIHLATSWLSQHSSSQISQLIQSNIIFGTQILEATKLSKIPFFINTSTFGNYCNSLSYRPSSLYAATKMAFEKIIDYYSLTSQTIFSHILIYNTYGPHDNQTRLFTLLQNIAKNNTELKMSEGKQIIDITHIDDIIAGFEIMIDHILHNQAFYQNKIFSLKNPNRRTLREIVETFEKILGKKLNILWGAREKRELEIEVPWEGGENLPNWKPKISLSEGINRFITQTRY